MVAVAKAVAALAVMAVAEAVAALAVMALEVPPARCRSARPYEPRHSLDFDSLDKPSEDVEIVVLFVDC